MFSKVAHVSQFFWNLGILPDPFGSNREPVSPWCGTFKGGVAEKTPDHPAEEHRSAADADLKLGEIWRMYAVCI